MKFEPWKIWNGGECPVNPDKKVQVQFSDETREDVLVEREKHTQPASNFIWEVDGVVYPIIAYREVIEPVRETVTEYAVYDKFHGLLTYQLKHPELTVKIIYDVIDGEVDCLTLRAEPVET